MVYADPFAELNKEAELKELSKPESPYQTEAFQIVKMKKSASSSRWLREVIDTIMVREGMVEAARAQAKSKAKRIGNCMVIEKLEKVEACYEVDSEAMNDAFRYKKFNGRRN